MAGEIYLSNLVGNFDYQPILEQFQIYKSQQIFLLQDKEAQIQQKKLAYQDFSNLLNTLKDDVDSLLAPSLFSEKLATVSDETALSVSITNPEKLSEANLDIQVLQLAQNDVWLSDSGKSDKNAAITNLDNGTLSISYKGTTIDINYDNTDSLQSIVDKINSAAASNNVNINASIFYDGTNYRLLIKGLDTGSSSKISISDSNSGTGSLVDELGGFSNPQVAQDAQISVYGTTVSSETNSFTNVIDGLSIEVKKVTTAPINITITNNFQPVKDNLQNLINDYNAIVDFVQNNSGENGVLSGDSTPQSIRSQIFRGLTPLMELGLLNVDKDTGHISINTAKLDDYLKNDVNTLKDKVSQLNDTLKDYLYFTVDPDGPINAKEKGFDRQIQNIEKRIEVDTKRINEEIELLKKQFVALQMYMAQMEDVQMRLSAMFGQQPQQ